MDLLFDNNTDYEIDEKLIGLIEKSIIQTLEHESFTSNVEISFSIVDNAEMREINRIHRNIDKATDVLSFPLIDDFADIQNNILRPLALGDIIVSIEKVVSQAYEYNHSLEREICFLTIHSMLHLLGYDHMVLDEERVMFKKQDEILVRLGIIR